MLLLPAKIVLRGKKNMKFFLIFSFITLFPFMGYANDKSSAIGSIVEVEGNATILQNGKIVLLLVDSPVYLNDMIETAAGSKAMVLFVDDTEFTLGEKSSLVIDEYVFDPEDEINRKAKFSALRGVFLFTSGLIEKRQTPDVEIITAYGTIGVRGTTVWGGDLDDQYGVFVQDGAVEIKNKQAPVRLGKGEGVNFSRKTFLPDHPKLWAAAKTERAVKTIALARQDVVRERISQRKKTFADLREKRRNEGIKKKNRSPRQLIKRERGLQR
jgi:hypothetical protein